MTTPFREFFHGKRCTLMGLGLLGRGVGDARFLSEHCTSVTVTDRKTAKELEPSLNELSDRSNISFRLGGHDFSDFENVDFVIKAAGVPLNDPYIEHAKRHGIPVYMSTALFAKLCQKMLIGVTGTRGKSSTSKMIYEILLAAGRKVLLGGNIRGMSTLEQLNRLQDFDLAVLELDSWQLQGFGDLKISPSISVFTNFYDDHLNYYNGNRDLYFADKANLFLNQGDDDILITTADLMSRIDRRSLKGKVALAGPLPTGFSLGGYRGAHNLQNAGLARVAALAAGAGEDDVILGLSKIEPDDGRLKLLEATGGVTFYNDSNATTQEATVAAINAFDPTKLVLIWGGADKQLDMTALVELINDLKLRNVMLGGTGTEKWHSAVTGFTPKIATTMDAAVMEACKLARPGDSVVLSPGFASFGIFRNEYDRSDQFNAVVRLLSKTGTIQ